MSAAVSLSKVKHPRYKYLVTFQDRGADGNTVRRKAYFATREAAISYQAEKKAQIGSHGAKHSHITDTERSALVRFRGWCENRKDPPSLLDLVNEAITARERVEVHCTVLELIDARLVQAQKAGLSERHKADLHYRLKHFGRAFGKRQAVELNAGEIESWLYEQGGSAQSFVNNKRVISSVFSLAVKRGKIPSNPVSGVESPKVTRKAPGVLSPTDLHNLLSVAPERLRPMLVLQAFAGLRRAESERITWGHIKLGGETPFVELPSAVTKTNRRRTVDLPPNAIQWLRQVQPTADTSLGYGTENYRYDLERTAKKAGIAWSENLLRHSFGSYRLAQIKNVAQVADEMGNSPQVVRTHYQNLVPPDAVADYWKVSPSHVSANVVALAGTSERKAS